MHDIFFTALSVGPSILIDIDLRLLVFVCRFYNAEIIFSTNPMLFNGTKVFDNYIERQLW